MARMRRSSEQPLENSRTGKFELLSETCSSL